MDRYGYVYISKCAATGKRYIGQHKGPKDPSYIGSGALIKESLREHGLKNHSVRVVEYADDNEDLNAKEIKWIARTQADISDDYLNISDLPGAQAEINVAQDLDAAKGFADALQREKGRGHHSIALSNGRGLAVCSLPARGCLSRCLSAGRRPLAGTRSQNLGHPGTRNRSSTGRYWPGSSSRG